ncbi:MAG: glycosyltransferase family 2 protein [Thermoleophilia bacterium]|nr:glycosyltransferase family 2 protein [Thermoleophilia bacterium]
MTAVVPCHRERPRPGVVEGLRRHVGEVLVVDDGMPPAAAGELRAWAARTGTQVLRLPRNAGKGTAVRAGIDHLLARARPPDAVLVVDGDGQHPVDAVPRFIAAAGAGVDLVVGDRFGDLRRMPVERRLANLAASGLLGALTGRPVRDCQCGMRLLAGAALHDVEFPRGGFEAETVHLKRCLRRGVRVGWVPIPAIYGDERSAFRAVRDSVRVVGASLRP